MPTPYPKGYRSRARYRGEDGKVAVDPTETYTPWTRRQLHEFFDERTQEWFISWTDQYGNPVDIESVTWDSQRKVNHDFLLPQQKAIIVNSILQWRVNGADPFEVASEAKKVMPRLPGQWPLTRRCVHVWDTTRQREKLKGNYWPFRSLQQFLDNGLCGNEATWDLYEDLNRRMGIRPFLGISGGMPGKRRVLKYSAREVAKQLRLYQTDRTLYEKPDPHGTIRGRVWYEVIVAAKRVRKLKAEGVTSARFQVACGILRGTVLAYAAFVDPYSLEKEDLRSDVIKTIESEAIRCAREDDQLG